jgi:hypothetical protein
MVAAVNSAATPIASRYEAARSSRKRAPLLIHYHIFKNAGTSFKESVTQAPIEKALSYYDSFNPRGSSSRRDLARFARRHPVLSL